MIIQSGIKHVIYMSDKHCAKKTTIAAKRMLEAAGVEYRYKIIKYFSLVIKKEETFKTFQLPLDQFPSNAEQLKSIENVLTER